MQGMPGNGREVLFCPNCGYDLHAQDYLDIEKLAGRSRPISAEQSSTTFSCPQCAYSGKAFSILESERYKLEFDLDSLDEPVIHAQKGSSRLFLYLLGIIIVILSILQSWGTSLSAALAFVLLGSIIFLEARSLSKRKHRRK